MTEQNDNQENRYRMLFENMLNGFAYCKMIFDEGNPVGFIYLDVNKSFEKLTGLKNVVGKKVSEIIPGIQKTNPELFEIYGRVASTGQTERFETYLESLDLSLDISVYSPGKDHFVAVFENISERKRTDQEQSYKTALFEALFNSSTEGFLIVDNQGKKVFQNRRTVDLWEIPQHIADDPDDHVQLKHVMNLTKYPDKFVNKVMYLYSHPEETTQDEVELINGTVLGRYSAPVLDKNGKNYGRVWSFHDITERKKSEQSLKMMNERLDLATRAGQMGIWDWNILSNKLEWDDKMFELYGVEKQKFAGAYEAWLNGLHPDDAERCNHESELARTGQEKYDTEFRIVHPDGNIRHIKALGTVMRDTEGNPVRMIGVNYDITRQKEFEKQLRDEKTRITEILAGIADTFFSLDTDWCFTIVNPSAEKAPFGRSAEELLGKVIWDLYPGLKKTEIYPHYLNAAVNQTLEHYEAQSPLNGRWYEVFMQGWKGGIDVYMRDITQRKHMEQSIQKTQKLESLGVLAAGIAHDFNNLLGGIFGYIDLASGNIKEKPASDYLEKALAMIDRARSLTQQLLTFAKGGYPVKKPENLPPLVRDTVQFVLSSSDVSCNFDIPENLWMCEFDRNQLVQVINNIVINALEAMPGGGTIAVSAENLKLNKKLFATLPAGNYVKMSFKDSGNGIPAEILPKIFDPFFTTKAKGHGLGLAVCYSVISRHGGYIEAESESGRGSTFNIYLPASLDTISADTDETIESYKNSGTILVMDDEEAIRDILGFMLKSLGYSVICAQNGNEAIDLFRKVTENNRNFAALILDLTIPGGYGGCETIREIRRTDRKVPAFVVSGYADDPVMANPSEYGFTASICKPFTGETLSELLNKYLKD